MLTGTLNPVSNQATWIEDFQLLDIETGDLIDISTATEIKIVVRDPVSKSSVLTLKLSSGEVVVVSIGVFEWRAEASQMRTLTARTYELGCIIDQDGDTVQLIIGTLPVLDGIV